MDATLKEIYSLVLTQWPLVASAYALLWAGLIAYVAFALKRMRSLEREVEVLESALARRGFTVVDSAGPEVKPQAVTSDRSTKE